VNGTYWRTVSTYSPTSRYQLLVRLPAFSCRTTTITLKRVLSKHQQRV